MTGNGKKIEIVKGKDNVKQIIITRREPIPPPKPRTSIITPAKIIPKSSIDSLVAGLLHDDYDLEMPGGLGSHQNSITAAPLGQVAPANNKSVE